VVDVEHLETIRSAARFDKQDTKKKTPSVSWANEEKAMINDSKFVVKYPRYIRALISEYGSDIDMEVQQSQYYERMRVLQLVYTRYQLEVMCDSKLAKIIASISSIVSKGLVSEDSLKWLASQGGSGAAYVPGVNTEFECKVYKNEVFH